MKFPELSSADLTTLAAIALTGFPLQRQREAIILLMQRIAVSKTDVSSLASKLQGKGFSEQITELEQFAKKKNAALKEITTYLN